MTALMLVCGLAGAPGLTADIAIVQGATLALFFAFSANARNVIFADTSGSTSHLLLRGRLLLLLPLAVPAFILSSVIGSVDSLLALVLIVRRSSEWIGEVFLSACEVQNDKKPAVLTIGAECLTFVLTIVLIFPMGVSPATAMILWALAPLVAALSGKLTVSTVPVSLMHNLAKLAPNLGSTTIIGITVYVFRLSIIMLVGRIVAGDLFAAFVIGGIIPTIYNSSIGPSLALRASGSASKDLAYRAMQWLVPGMFIFGFAVFFFSMNYPEMANLFRKDHHFWTAVGLSLSGGAIMMIALHRRIMMLQREMNVEIFGSDVLSNILIVVSVPYFYYLLGERSLEGLYVFNAVLTLCFYWSAERSGKLAEAPGRHNTLNLFIIAGLVLLPFFFQLNGGIFRDSAFIFDTGRILKQLPIPLSVIALIAGVLLLGRFRETHRSLTVFFFTALMLVLATLVIREPDARNARLILMAQYLMPILGLVLGEMYGVASEKGEFEKTCLAVVCFIVPVQLFCSWLQGLVILTPYLYFFSIYQHILYVPVIMIIAYGMAFVCLWGQGGKLKIVLCASLPLVAIYACASYSIEVLIVFLGIVFVAVWKHDPSVLSRRAAVCILALALFSGIAYGAAARTSILEKTSPVFSTVLERSNAKYSLTTTLSSPKDLTERLRQWEFYGRGIISGTREFFFGHPYPPDRRVHPSAHNYYLDLLYNFGFFALLPLLILLVYTGILTYRCRSILRTDRFLLAAVLSVFVMFLIDNSLKVGLRQPYPGIFGFFLLGFLQARFSRSVRSLH